MAKKKIKQNSKVIMEQKRRKRRLLTLWRIVKYGFNSFRRNAWLSVAATAIMTITLTIIFSSFLARMAITNTIDSLTEKIGVSIYLKKDVKPSDAKEMQKTLEKLSTVKKVEYASSEDNQRQYANKNRNDETTTQALIEASNEFFASFSVTLKDIGDTSELRKTVESDKLIQKNLHETKEPTYKSSRKESIETIANAFSVVEKIGMVAVIIFALISGLIIFNTIRMAIFNRREEIYMMKLIGANKGFISGPFIVESIICGMLAAVFATGIGYALVHFARPKLESWGILLNDIVVNWMSYVILILPLLMILGAMIGVVSSWIATRKYLKL